LNSDEYKKNHNDTHHDDTNSTKPDGKDHQHHKHGNGTRGHHGRKHKKLYMNIWGFIKNIFDKIIHFDIYFPVFLTIIVFGFFYVMYFQKRNAPPTKDAKVEKLSAWIWYLKGYKPLILNLTKIILLKFKTSWFWNFIIIQN